MTSTMTDPAEDVEDAPPVEGARTSGVRPLSVEARTAVAVVIPFACALAIALFDFSGRALVTAVTASALVYLAAIDIEQRILPNRILLPVTVFVLAAQIAFFPDHAVEWLLAGLTAAAFLAAPRVVRRDGMGMGDIKLAVLLGVATGWSVFTAIIIGCLAMIPVALWMLRRDGSIRGATLPFGPFLAFGTLVILFAS
jgi:leader peptidase (prepilin peptidase)/N-methyltransferase